MSTHGLVLAAGAGRRMGRPKALVADADGPWLLRAVRALSEGGCAGVTVVLGAEADRARALLAPTATAPTATAPTSTQMTSEPRIVVAADWAEGMGASLRAGLADLETSTPDRTAVMITLVDLPDVGPEVVRRVLLEAGTSVLRRAAYQGRPGHPVLAGREHWAPIAAAAVGDRGARDYLASRPVELVECGDLATGTDQDRPTPGR